MIFNDVFGEKPCLIGCIHLAALPGSPRYAGSMSDVYQQALEEAEIYRRSGIDGLIVENFRDRPFYPDRVPPETVAAIATVTREIVSAVKLPIGVNVLRNDAEAALAIAVAAKAHFIRINVHMGAVVSEQGIIQGRAHETLRRREALKAKVLIFSDVGVKHSSPLASRGLATEAYDATERGFADALIVSGEITGREVNMQDVEAVHGASKLPLFIGSGANPENIGKLAGKVRGVIVGTYCKTDGESENLVDEARVRRMVEAFKALK